jgi:hypothetical protein
MLHFIFEHLYSLLFDVTCTEKYSLEQSTNNKKDI